ncbi:hypothetical protein HOE425_310158 [Hoeflea sp. EC-HK425]|nr:hypothetical protein HOE425_310158 [Hoeflea sp. EC-HK425]
MLANLTFHAFFAAHFALSSNLSISIYRIAGPCNAQDNHSSGPRLTGSGSQVSQRSSDIPDLNRDCCSLSGCISEIVTII